MLVSQAYPDRANLAHMPTLAITSGHYTSFAHKYLWEGVQVHLEIAKERPADSWMLHLSAGLLAAAAFEAYLNYVGEEALPHIWEQERAFFSKPEYKGTRGKLKRIAEELGYSLPPTTHKPFRGWLELVSLRDKLVHGRPKRVEYRAKHRVADFPRLPTGWMASEAPVERIRARIGDTETLAVELHTLLQASEFRFVVFGGHPLIGALGFGTRSVEQVS
jgi:hypothetical protein